jgi:hypothetical protein
MIAPRKLAPVESQVRKSALGTIARMMTRRTRMEMATYRSRAEEKQQRARKR